MNTSMNFWEFKEDHSRGYYLPTSNKAARDHGGQLVNGLFFLIVSVLKLTRGILIATVSLIFTILRLLQKWTKN